MLGHFDAAKASSDARREARNREAHCPPVSTYRWWARRTQAVYGALLDAVAETTPQRLLVADVYAGGGAIALASALRGHQVYAQDINPWAISGLAAMLAPPPADLLEAAANTLADEARRLLSAAYATSFVDGEPATIAHTLRVAVSRCPDCGHSQPLYPHALVSLTVRRDRPGAGTAYLACRSGHLSAGSPTKPSDCPECGDAIDPEASYTERRTVTCTSCNGTSTLADRATADPWSWQIALVERVAGSRRELAPPTHVEIAQADSSHWVPRRDLGAIPEGVETRVLRRHGYRSWHDLYPTRQRHVLEHLLALAPTTSDHERVVRALRLALVATAEMAGYMSRWDRYYLKSYEAMAGHRFNLTTFAAEPNVWGAAGAGRGTGRRRVAALAKAARWMAERGADRLSIQGPPSTTRRLELADGRDVRLVEGSSERVGLPDASADLTLTDPCYHDDVQYGELSLLLRAWAEMDVAPLAGEALFNRTLGDRAGDNYEQLLTAIFKECRRILRPNGRLVLGYANRDPHAWVALFAALEAADFRAVGCEAVEAENDSDYTKRGRSACAYDLIMDLVPDRRLPVRRHSPRNLPETDEGAFLQIVAQAFLRVGTHSADRWREQLLKRLRTTAFRGAATPEAGGSTKQRKPDDDRN